MEEEYLEEDEEPTCPYGYTWDECCGCVLRYGVETCEFSCPFTKKLPRPCYSKECDKLIEEKIDG